jgi:hypothetical protein
MAMPIEIFGLSFIGVVILVGIFFISLIFGYLFNCTGSDDWVAIIPASVNTVIFFGIMKFLGMI